MNPGKPPQKLTGTGAGSSSHLTPQKKQPAPKPAAAAQPPGTFPDRAPLQFHIHIAQLIPKPAEPNQQRTRQQEQKQRDRHRGQYHRPSVRFIPHNSLLFHKAVYTNVRNIAHFSYAVNTLLSISLSSRHCPTIPLRHNLLAFFRRFPYFPPYPRPGN